MPAWLKKALAALIPPPGDDPLDEFERLTATRPPSAPVITTATLLARTPSLTDPLPAVSRPETEPPRFSVLDQLQLDDPRSRALRAEWEARWNEF